MKIEEGDLKKFILIGDKILVKPKKPEAKTKSGLYLPPGVQEKDKMASGYVLKVGPGYPIPNVEEVDDLLYNGEKEAKFIPLQVKEGDLAVYLQKSGFEIQFNNEKYLILSYSSIMMVVRDENLFS